MKIKYIIGAVLAVCLVGAVVAQPGSAPPAESYHSLKNPDWPPLPAPPRANLPQHEIEPGKILVDDRNMIYPAPAAPPIGQREGDARYNWPVRRPVHGYAWATKTNDMLRFPEMIDFMRAKFRNLTPDDRVFLDQIEQAALSPTNTLRAPYTWHEHNRFNAAVRLADVARTNPVGLANGIQGNGWTAKIDEGKHPEIIALGELSKAALAATNRALVDQVLNEYRRVWPNRPEERQSQP